MKLNKGKMLENYSFSLGLDRYKHLLHCKTSKIRSKANRQITW